MSVGRPGTLSIDWGEAEKAPADRKRWLGAWLVSTDGEEGEYFYDGPGRTKNNAQRAARSTRLPSALVSGRERCGRQP